MQDKSTEYIKKYFEKNTEHLLKKLIKPAPIVLYFGAGASYGSDSPSLFKRGLLPPLGKELYSCLVKDSSTKYWKKIPTELQLIFKENFELAFEKIMDNDEKYNLYFRLLSEMALYFSKFEPQKNNLYKKLAQKIYEKRRHVSIITLNYDPLLQHSLFKSGVFPITLGVMKNDLGGEFTAIPIDIIYPHGACQFNMYIPDDFDKKSFNNTSKIVGGAGIYQFFEKINIMNSYIKRDRFPGSRPLMCAYEPDKRPFAQNYFIDYQRDYYNQAIKRAQKIIVIGVNCNYERDRHLWDAMEETSAEIIFIEPFEAGRQKIAEWNNNNVRIIPKYFKEAFEEICEIAELN